MNFRISVKAAEDLEKIWLYTYENWSIEQADRYLNLIFDEISFLAKNPQNGVEFGDVRSGYLYSKVKSHLIFYKRNEKKKVVDVIRILHERMDLGNRLIAEFKLQMHLLS